jgi:hypothetical protein
MSYNALYGFAVYLLYRSSGKSPCPPGRLGTCDAYRITFTEDGSITWSCHDQIAALDAVEEVGESMASLLRRYSFMPYHVFREVFGPVEFHLLRTPGDDCMLDRGRGGVTCPRDTIGDMTSPWIAHELGHLFNARVEDRGMTTPYDVLETEGVYAMEDEGLRQIAGLCNEGYLRTDLGYRPNVGGRRYQWNTAATKGEDFADMFSNWTYDTFADDIYGKAEWMDERPHV